MSKETLLNHDFPELIRIRLRSELPGVESHKMLSAYKRPTAAQVVASDKEPRLSAVMMLIYQLNNEWHTVFIERPDNQGIHSNQLSFPGGKLEEGETWQDAAIRETQEEVGITESQLEILGQLTDLYIPPSNFLVRPFIAHVKRPFQFTINPDEVKSLIETPVHTFLQQPILSIQEIRLSHMNMKLHAPAFDLGGKILWGATAMMVQEFRVMFGYEG